MKANKIVSGVLALTMVLGGLALPAEVCEKAGFGSAISAEAETYGDFEYSVLDDGTVEITKYTGSGPSVTIPSKINGKKVTSIGSCAFYEWYGLTSITIPDSVTSIGHKAFAYCISLTSINIPDSVTSIGGSAFLNCISLSSITMPNSVTSIERSTFEACIGLTSITIPESVTSIGELAFESCTSLTSITIPESVTSIGEYAFVSCDSLTSIMIPESVTSIGEYTFGSCSSLTSITIPDSVTSIGESAFCDCTSLTDVYYTGSSKDWEKISIGVYNDCLTNATIHYNYSSAKEVGKAVTTKFSCTDTAIRINWKKATNASGYRIYRYNTSTKKWETAATLSGGNTLTYKQTGLKSGTTYKYKVKAYAKSNGKTYWGEPSDTMTTTTNPSKPVIKSYGATSNAIRINWNTVTGATGYRVYRYDTKTKKYAVIATIRDGSANTYRDSGRKAKTSYQYKVKAYRKLGSVNYWSEASAAKTCKTK